MQKNLFVCCSLLFRSNLKSSLSVSPGSSLSRDAVFHQRVDLPKQLKHIREQKHTLEREEGSLAVQQEVLAFGLAAALGMRLELHQTCECVSSHSSASLPEPWAAGPDTAGRRDLQTMFMTVGLLLGLATKDRLYTLTHTEAGPEPGCRDSGLT